jgi:superfamily I DNA/RNA helicase
MDAIENARQIATQLHAERVSKGCDPTKPYNFVKSAIESRELFLEDTKPGAVLLDGGRAKYIPNEALVLHERCESEFENAFLAAHELGHVVLGDGADCEQSPAIEMDRSAEPPPDAEYRVVDYGRLQRREIQMDLFAREFLLPRQYVRNLHVDQGLSASEIAKRHGAPFEVVAQQLLDAVLLPPCVDSGEFFSAERPLNPQQEKAALHHGDALLVEAGPGTGKTQTLTSRVASLLDDGIDPRKILLLTFSNKAAAEMADRIAKKNPEGAAAMWIGTFHSFGLDIVRRFRQELGFEKDPRLLDRTEAVELLEEEFPRFGLKHYRNIYDPVQLIDSILDAISRAKDEVVDAANYRQLAIAMHENAKSQGNLDKIEAAEKCLEIAEVYDAYERIKESKQLIDFGDLVLRPVKLLESQAAIRDKIASTYQHVLVDEYQDVNRSSVRLLKCLSPTGENLWVVGDSKQSIYRFRGASSLNMKRFGVDDFPGGQRLSLNVNYRSVPEITEVFSNFAARMPQSISGATGSIEPSRESIGANAELRTVDRAADEAPAIAEAIEELRAKGYAYRDQAVLCTGNGKLAKFAVDLESLGIPVLFLGNIFERREVRDLLAFLSLLVDRRATGLLRIGRLDDFRLTLSDVAATIEGLRTESPQDSHWHSRIDSLDTVSVTGKVTLRSIASTIQGFDNESSPWIVLATVIFDRTRLGVELAKASAVTDQTAAIAVWQLMNFLKHQPAGKGLPIPRVLDRIRRLVRLGDDKELRKLPEVASGLDGIRLLTVHGSKGLEFPVIHFPGLNNTSLPKSFRRPDCPVPGGMIEGATEGPDLHDRKSHNEEQQCLFFVALSRARDRLIGYAPTRKSNNHKWSLTPFIDELGQAIVRKHIKPKSKINAEKVDLPIEFSIEGPCNFSADQIGLYESCRRRFFYTHILQIGGRRKTTPFMLMHEAVRALCEEFVTKNVSKITDDELREKIGSQFQSVGLDEHGYTLNFRAHAIRLLKYFVSTRDIGDPVKPTTVAITIDGDQLTFEPDDCFLVADGDGHRFRAVKTGGYKPKVDDLAAAALLLAANEHVAASEVEFVHLSDQDITPITITHEKLKTKTELLRQVLSSIRSGSFEAKSDERICPSCPAYFVCGEVPSGPLRKTF